MNLPADLRVGMDGFNLAMLHGTGVATYGRTLAAALNGLGRRLDLIYGLNVPPGTPPELRETLFFAALAEGVSGDDAPARTTAWGRLRRALLSPAPRDLIEVPASGRVVRRGVAERVPAFDRLFTLNRLFYLGRRYLRRYGRLLPVRIAEPPAIMHWTYPVPVRLLGARNVYTIHDLVPLRLPFLSLEDKAYHERLLRACTDAAAHVLTVSETSRADILDYLPVAPERVTNAYQAVPGQFARNAAPDLLARRLRALFDLEPQDYFLFYGAIEPKKNVGRLIEAYLAADVSTQLVLAGPRAWRAEGELRLLDGAHGARLSGADRIRRIDYLPAEHLELLLRGARALVFPSLYEGFGLPPVEAMAAGVPVIAGNGGSLPEIVGDAALCVDSYDAGAISAALERIDRDADLRTALADAGRVRAADFSLQAFQARIADLHARLMAEPAPRRSSSTPAIAATTEI